jgi:ribosomal protein S18 acetylase RimI-like enzyme
MVDVCIVGWQSLPMAAVEQARPEDIEQIREIAGQVFGIYGDYGEILPRFFESQGVTTFVGRVGPKIIGFVMFGFIPWTKGRTDSSAWIADLLALAVTPEYRRHGVGNELIARAMQLIDEMSEWRDIREIQLTCAESNSVGLEFFANHGFKVIDPRHGSYSAGQTAVRLARPYP